MEKIIKILFSIILFLHSSKIFGFASLYQFGVKGAHKIQSLQAGPQVQIAFGRKYILGLEGTLSFFHSNVLTTLGQKDSKQKKMQFGISINNYYFFQATTKSSAYFNGLIHLQDLGSISKASLFWGSGGGYQLYLERDFKVMAGISIATNITSLTEGPLLLVPSLNIELLWSL